LITLITSVTSITGAEALAACLRQPAFFPPTLGPDVCEHLHEQGVGPLVYRALCERHLLDAQPTIVRDQLTRLYREETILEPFRREEVARVLDSLAAAGVRALVFKGTALAYTCYPEPALRPRLDTDLLIRRDDVDEASRVFERLGCTRALRTAGELVTHQFTYVSAQHGLDIAFDVHWKVSDPQPFADLFSFEELEGEARPVPALARAARVLGDEYALLVACTHRIAHHYDREILIFLYDIDLLARRLDVSGWDRVVEMARAKRICHVTLRGLDLASNLLGTPIPKPVRSALADDSTTSRGDEPTSVYLDGGLRKIDILRADLRQLKWRDRLRLIREHLLPAPAFVLRSYGQTRREILPVILPILYLIRIVRGASAWFRPLR
jgi:Uncharacterised nucleotidyltransferase